jgi:hypothetical protein
MSTRFKRVARAALCAAILGLILAPVASAAFDDPLFVVRPAPPPPPAERKPPPNGDFEAPCGIAVDEQGGVLVSEYYNDAIDLFGGPGSSNPFGPTYPYGYTGQILDLDALEGGPCGMAFDADGSLYLYDYHRAVFKLDPSFSVTTPVAGTGVDATHPTGVGVNRANGNVFVNERTQIAVFGPGGALVRVLAASSLGDGFGLAVSEYFGSQGFVYVADAASQTVKAYAPEPLDPGAGPVVEIDGSETPLGHFVSLRDAALAVDRETGDLYVTDNLQPQFAERPETVVYVFDAAGAYQGRLKYSIENAVPPGLAVDNSDGASQGRVYVTSGNTEHAAVYAYRPGSATANAVPVPLLEEPPEDPSGPVASAPDPPAVQGAAAPEGPLALPAISAALTPAPVAAPAARTGAKARARARARRAKAKARARQRARHRAHKHSSGASR